MSWKPFSAFEELNEIIASSHQQPQLIFKHSTRCSISSVVKNRLEKASGATPIYFLDLIANRSVSNSIAEIFAVHHESPQLLVIKDGKCIFHESHTAIHFDDVLPLISSN
jgi:bacillithiol system protein YtxJ